MVDDDVVGRGGFGEVRPTLIDADACSHRRLLHFDVGDRADHVPTSTAAGTAVVPLGRERRRARAQRLRGFAGERYPVHQPGIRVACHMCSSGRVKRPGARHDGWRPLPGGGPPQRQLRPAKDTTRTSGSLHGRSARAARRSREAASLSAVVARAPGRRWTSLSSVQS